MALQAAPNSSTASQTVLANGYNIKTAPESENKLIKWRGATFEGHNSPTQDMSNGYPATENGYGSSHAPKPIMAGASTADVADFFNPEIFQVVLHNPTTSYQMLRFSQSRFCGENMEFLEKVDRFNTLLDEMTKIMSDIHRSYTSTEAPRQLNLAPHVLKRMNADIKHTTQSTLPALELVFSDAQESIEKLLAADVYPRFVKYQVTMSAVKALSTDRGKYAGLGDCFCLTNPSVADNPIQFASDGFVAVTGYPRTDIIPRNCRFLQGSYTDRSAVHRIKVATEENKESVELLLNYRKNGEPFWNLLYVCPLFGPDGRVAFFLGGQINCSTTIHSRSDVLRVLSISDEMEEENPSLQPALQEAANKKGGLFNLFRNRDKEKVTSEKETGMEQNLIKQIERMDFRNQVQMFHSAYSKFLVMPYPALTVSFYSLAIVDMLAMTADFEKELIGCDIFRVLAGHSQTTNPSIKDFRHKIKSFLRLGKAVSSEIGLTVKRSGMIRRGLERFNTHWTPCKDEKGEVAWVVVTMATLTKNW